jgi:hypothetical protein
MKLYYSLVFGRTGLEIRLDQLEDGEVCECMFPTSYPGVGPVHKRFQRVGIALVRLNPIAKWEKQTQVFYNWFDTCSRYPSTKFSRVIIL